MNIREIEEKKVRVKKNLQILEKYYSKKKSKLQREIIELDKEIFKIVEKNYSGGKR